MCVVLIHLPLGKDGVWTEWIWIASRKIVNFAVATFFFLSAYYTKPFQNILKEGLSKFYKKRIKRLFIPYILWSCFYIFVLSTIQRGTIPNDWLLLLCTGIGPTYFLLALLQLTLLYPLFHKYKNNKVIDYIFWTITPLYIVFYYTWNFQHGKEFMLGQFFCFPWFAAYYLGLKLQNHNALYSKQLPPPTINPKRLFTAVFLVIATLIFSIIEGMSIFHISNIFSFSISQITLGSIVYSLSFIYLIWIIAPHVYNRENILSKIGDYSMGIFLVHPLFNALLIFTVYHLSYTSIFYSTWYGYMISNIFIWVTSIYLSYQFSKQICKYSIKLSLLLGLR